MNIFLSGGGSGEKSKEVDLEFLKNIDCSKPVLYIPLARMPPYTSCKEWIISNFKQFNFNNFEMLESFEDLKKINLSKYSAVYVGGGNTFLLLNGLKENQCLTLFKEYILQGGIFYGGSAGAIITGKDIGTSKSVNEINLTDLDSMNLFENLSIFCHYKGEEDDKKIKEYISKNKTSILVLPENSGIQYYQGKIRVFGPGSMFFFNNSEKKEILPDAILKPQDLY
jgi:dipeptidase E